MAEESGISEHSPKNSDTESAEVKATSTITIATTAGTNADETEADAEATTESEETQTKKSKRHLPSLSAMFKRLNERDSRKKKYAAEPEITEGETADAEADQQHAGVERTDGNDNEPKEDKQLVYAELVLKPADTNEPAQPPTLQPKNSTEYAEIVYVQKPQAEQSKN